MSTDLEYELRMARDTIRALRRSRQDARTLWWLCKHATIQLDGSIVFRADTKQRDPEAIRKLLTELRGPTE